MTCQIDGCWEDSCADHGLATGWSGLSYNNFPLKPSKYAPGTGVSGPLAVISVATNSYIKHTDCNFPLSFDGWHSDPTSNKLYAMLYTKIWILKSVDSGQAMYESKSVGVKLILYKEDLEILNLKAIIVYNLLEEKIKYGIKELESLIKFETAKVHVPDKYKATLQPALTNVPYASNSSYKIMTYEPK